MTTQLQVQKAAAQNKQQFASVNHGKPAVVAAAKPVAVGKPSYVSRHPKGFSDDR